jgi:hypothetical protein
MPRRLFQRLPVGTKATRYWLAAKFLIGTGVAALLVSAGLYWHELNAGQFSGNSEDWGAFGAYIAGAAGTVISLGTLIALAITLALQAEDLEQTRSAMQQQISAAQRQIFDSTFFSLLHRFNEVLDAISAGPVPTALGIDMVSGREAIQRIFKEMASGFPAHVIPAEQTLPAIVEMHRATYIKYEAFLGPYFRLLYHVFKFINNSSHLSDSEMVEYANIARAQLSRYELALAFYNCLTPYGERFKPLIEKFGILKHVNDADLVNARHKDDAMLYAPTAFMSEEQRAQVAPARPSH